MEIERRKEKRIKVEDLPENLKTISFSIGNFGEFPATTIDASNSGMSFVAFGIFENDVSPGQELIIHIKDNNCGLKARLIYAEIEYVNEVGEDLLRFGVSFKNASSLKKYQDILKDGKTD